MAESHVISALVAKRSELAGLVAHHRKEMARLSEEVKTVDATIKLFAPCYRTESIKPKRHQKPNGFFVHGEANRMILDILRESGKPLSTGDITNLLISIKGIGGGHEKTLQASVLTILHRHRKSRLVENTGKDAKGNCIWVLSS